MKRNFLLLALTTLLVATQVQAQILSQVVTWQATANKGSQSSVSLLHLGHQSISTASPTEQILAATLTEPTSGVTLQARALNTVIDPLSITLNGKNLTYEYQDLPATEHYYLGYHSSSDQVNNITEGGYELIFYWQP